MFSRPRDSRMVILCHRDKATRLLQIKTLPLYDSWDSSHCQRNNQEHTFSTKPNQFCFLFLLSTIFYFFSHITQHSIQNITKQNNRHILNISRSNQKGGGEGRTIKTQKSLPYTITYVQQKNTAKHQWSKAWPHQLALLYIHMSLFAGGYGSNMFFYTCVV